MTKPEFDEMAALVVRLRDVTAGVEEVNEELTKALAANVDALVKSNAQCADYLLHNEMLAADRSTLHKELVEVRAALASVSEERDSLKRTLKKWEEAETAPHVRVAADDIADHVVPPVLSSTAALPLCHSCHGCGDVLADWGYALGCPNNDCDRYEVGGALTPYQGLCNSPHPVRHE